MGFVVGFAALGVILVATRLVGLDRSFWHDEILTLTEYVRAGPREIMTGAYIPNNHQLFSLLGWATSSVFGDSEVVLRLLSVIPFLVGVALVTWWMVVRIGSLPALVYLFLVTVSPLLLDLSRQARGYGLAFLAMSLLVVAALEADRTRATGWIVAFCVAGTVGTWTLPNFGVAFAAAAVVLAAAPALRRRTTVGLIVSMVALAAWYAPSAREVVTSSQQEHGAPIPWFGLLASPIDQVLVPAMGVAIRPGVPWALLVVGVAVVLLSSPLLHDRTTALLLTTPIIAMFVLLWATRVGMQPRFVSFLLVPLLLLFATGATSVVARRPRPDLRAPLAAALLALAAVAAVPQAARVMRLPREAHKDVAAFIERESAPNEPVLAYMHQPEDLAFYLDRPVESLGHTPAVEEICERRTRFVFVWQPLFVEPPRASCLVRPDVVRHRLEQYTRGGWIDVWLLPAGRQERG